ncbi:major facilitator superfamily [Lipomyces tetrasporus]
MSEAAVTKEATTGAHAVEEPVSMTRPNGWMYKAPKIGQVTLPWYASPKVQLGMVAFVCFLCPGMFNALGGMGGGGKTDATLADQMNTALYSTFAVVGFFAGTFVNRLGVRLTIAFGGIGYCIYAISLLVSVHKNVAGFNIFAGVLLGVCAGLLWTAQGTIMLSYPLEHEKGRYFAWFWAIFNVGACVGSMVFLGQNINVTENVTASDGAYIGLIVLMFCGAVLAVFLVDAHKIIRSDGSKVILMKNPSWKSEFVGLWAAIRSEPFVILLFPMFWSSNWFYTYQENSINGAHFDTRTKALNDFLYWFAQIVAASILGPILDLKYFRRSVRGKAALIGLFSLTMVIYGGGYAFQKQYTRGSPDNNEDWTTSGYAGPMFLYFFYGLFDACWQGTVYWFLGALSNSGRRTANFVGFYKGIQSAGAVVMWAWDSTSPEFMTEFASNWGLLCGSLVVAAPVVWLKIKDHVDILEDLMDVDETIEDVLPAGDAEKRAFGEEAI